ncbi:MAG TPA: hypothetical protein VKQ30_25440 [Ktedonobacterales bacterium]|nr:hypothetical protein [Ktedonobacterales bacterium]
MATRKTTTSDTSDTGLEPYRELSRRLGRAPQYSITTAPVRKDRARNRHVQLASQALAEVGAQDVGHPAILARERAQQTPAVVDARARVLKADSERFHLQQDIASGRYHDARDRAAKLKRMHALEREVATHAKAEAAAYATAYKAELKNIPKAPKAAKKPAKKPFTVGRYQPKSATIAEIAGARRNRRVQTLERKMARQSAYAYRAEHPGEYERTAEAYHRARDSEIAAIRAGTATSHPRTRALRSTGTVGTGGHARNPHAWPHEHPAEHRAAARLGWKRRHSGA